MAQPLRPAHTLPTSLRHLIDAARAQAQQQDPDQGRVRGPARFAGPATGDPLISGVSLDSRGVQPGDLYAALPGARAHGAQFTADALVAGAAAVLTDPTGLDLIGRQPAVPVVVVPDPRALLGYVAAQAYGRPADTLPLVGITGTNGKTTTAYLLDAALRAAGRRTGVIGTIETRIGDQRLPSERTTPESPDLHALLAVMLEIDVQVATMEVSSHALALHRVDGAWFDVAAFTNLSQDHLDFHGTMEEYFAAKAGLFAPQRCGHAVIVTQEAWGARLAVQARAAGVRVTTLASTASTGPDWIVTPAADDPHGFTLTGPDHPSLALRSGLPGRHNVVNAAVAALIMLTLGYEAAQVGQALGGDPGVPGRLEQVDLGVGAPLAFVDFAHTPEAITATLTALRDCQAVTGPLVAVLGAGGGRDQGKRPVMGQCAAQQADVVIVTDDNPRLEDPATIRTAVLAGAQRVPGRQVEEIAGRTAALVRALELAGPDGLVAVLGKGHERGQEIAGTIHPYDDRQALREAYRTLTGASTEAAETNDAGDTGEQPRKGAQ